MAAKEATFSQQPESSNSRTRNGELLESAEKSDTPTIKTNACGFFFTFCHKNAPDIEGAEVFSRVDITDNSL